jgi:hypothetical protein
VQVAKCDSLEWNKGRLDHCYHLIGVRNGDSEYEHWPFHDVIDLIGAYAQPEYLKVKMEYNDELRSDNFDRLEAIKAAK